MEVGPEKKAIFHGCDFMVHGVPALVYLTLSHVNNASLIGYPIKASLTNDFQNTIPEPHCKGVGFMECLAKSLQTM